MWTSLLATVYMTLFHTPAVVLVIAAKNDVSNGTGSSSDYEKLMTALTEITSKFHNVETILQTFGLSTLPIAQRYGIFFGCVTFIGTIVTVLLLLIFGGTFTRIAKESSSSSSSNPNNDDPSIHATPSDIRQQRSLLYEELLEQRQRMMLRYNTDATNKGNNNNDNNRKGGITEFTQMLCNVAPTSSVNTSSTTITTPSTAVTTTPLSPMQQTAYQNHYRLAYRQCQDRPGGAIVSGHPEARYEAYARGYASCGHGSSIDTVHNNNNNCNLTVPYPILLDTSYRRSYGRMIESITCENHSTIEYYHNDLFLNRPLDIIGAYMRLEPLNHLQQQPQQQHQHVQEIYHSTCTGEPTMGCLKPYNPYDVWCFHEDGPFPNMEQIQQSKYIFSTHQNTAAFVIRQNITHHFVGIILLLNDEPEHLSVQLQIPLLAPKYSPSTCKECMEGYFLLIDRLFAYGYRRIYMMIDTQDVQSIQFIHRMGFTHEGCFYKHRIVKDANRNSNIYAILNSDWKQSNITATSTSSSSTGTGANMKSQMNFRGARAVLFQKLYGAAKFRADQNNERYEAEQEEQTLGLLEQKRQADNERVSSEGTTTTSSTDKKKK